MSFKSSTCSNPSIILVVDETKHLMWRTDARSEMLYHSSCALRDILAQQADSVESWMQYLKDRED